MSHIQIGGKPAFEATLEISRIIEEEITNRDLDDIFVEPEDFTKGFRVTAIPQNDLFSIGRSDITIYQKRDWSPPDLASDKIARWFPDKTLEIPLVEIEIKQTVGPKIRLQSRDLFTSADHVMGVVIHFSRGTSGWTADQFDTGVVFEADEVGDIADPSFVDPVFKHIEEYRDQELYTEDELRETLSQFKPDVFHFNEVLTAYQEERTKILIILLSVFFEGYVEEVLSDTMEELRQNEEPTKFYLGWGFAETLTACRFFGILDENEYRIMNQIRDERNDYAHEADSFHPDTASQVEESGALEEAIELYEEIIGVKDSMLADWSIRFALGTQCYHLPRRCCEI